MLFKSLTFKMYYDESKRKNFINYFDLVEHLVEEFIEVEPECQTKKSVNDLTLTELLSSNDKNSNNH